MKKSEFRQIRRKSAPQPETVVGRQSQRLKNWAKLFSTVVALGSLSLAAAQGQSTNNSLATLEIVHVADVNAPWFTTWFEAKELSEGSLFRPQIQISSGQALLEKVANSKSSIGLLSKSELQSALQLPNTIYSAPTGLEVCMALVVPEDSQVTQVGDLAVLSDTTNISATGDTVAILEALLGAYGLGEERTVSVNSGAAITSGLASGALALGALPVGQDHTSRCWMKPMD